MIKISFFGWNVGMRRLVFSKYLYSKTNLNFHETWNIGLEILDGKIVEIKVDTVELAKEIVSKSIELGVKARIEN